MLQYKPLIVREAYSYLRRYKGSFEIEDLQQEAFIAFGKAIENYSPDRGAGLPHYATFWIKAGLERFIRRNSSVCKRRDNKELRMIGYNYFRISTDLQKKNPNLEGLALYKRVAEVGEYSLDRVIEYALSKQSAVPISSGVQGDKEEGHVPLDKDTLDQENSLNSLIDAKHLERFLYHAEKSLNPKEQLVFKKRLMTDSPCTLREVGEDLCVTRERVRQIELRVREKLKEDLLEIG